MATTSIKAQTLQQQLNQAVKEAGEALQVDDLKSLTLALVEAAADLLKTDRALAERVRTRYVTIITGSNTSKTTSHTNENKKQPDLVPVKRIIDREFDISAPLDPYFLFELYGNNQLPLALSRYTVKQLQEGVAEVEQRFPGTKPKGKATKEILIDYIVRFISQ